MDYTVLWFVLIVVLFTGFFVLEGFDYGVGTLLPFISADEGEQGQILHTIGPVWNGNEVWMITAGGALFAAFPHVYATMFSTFYLALFLMLVALSLRGVGIELRSRHECPCWRQAWTKAICFGSALPAFLWGVAVTNLLTGLPIDERMIYQGGFFDLLSPATIMGGLTFFCVFLFHGATFLTLRLADERLMERARHFGGQFAKGAIACYLVLAGLLAVGTDLLQRLPAVGLLLLAVLLLVMGAARLQQKQAKQSFIFTSLAIVMTTVGFFAALFPRLMVSSLNPAWSLTITNSASSPYTLSIMTIAALCFVPIVLVYQGWSYWTFRHRITPDANHEY